MLLRGVCCVVRVVVWRVGCCALCGVCCMLIVGGLLLVDVCCVCVCCVLGVVCCLLCAD